MLGHTHWGGLDPLGTLSVFFIKFFFYKVYVCIILHFLFIYLFIYLGLCWVFVSVRGLSLVVASRGHSSSQCAGLSLSRPLPLRSTGSSRAGSVVVAHAPSCSAACGILPDQGSNLCPLHLQADSQPLRHQGSPFNFYLFYFWLRWVFVAERGLFSGCGEQGLLFVVVRDLIAVASLVAEHRL